ncbi:MAG TPA: porin family protein, partial [Alphaproteobacteria bacterium]|nr:porin family protein [Alphaproteobacteria bacterium]
MKRLLITLPATAVLLAGVSQAALAQSGPSGSWAGPYGGIHIGYGNGSGDDVETTGQAPANVSNVVSGARPGGVSVDEDGFVGGVALGYNLQSGNIVYGVEADIDYTDIEDSSTRTTTNAAGAALVNTFRNDLEYLGTLRARLGAVVNGGNTLV